MSQIKHMKHMRRNRKTNKNESHHIAFVDLAWLTYSTVVCTILCYARDCPVPISKLANSFPLFQSVDQMMQSPGFI